MIQFCNCLRLYLGIESVSSRLLQLGRIVCYTAVFRVVTQRSSPQTAAENRTTFLSLCVCGLTKKPIMYSWVARDVSKNQTKKLSILLSFYFHEVLQHLNIFT